VSVDARARLHDRKFYGVVVGVVSKNDDPDKLGRVKLNFPWFDGGHTETDWCRMAQLYAGGATGAPGPYGAVFVPEVGDEVLVAFDQGDMGTPYVLGGLYNGQDKPPVERSASKDVKMLRTKAGHVITLDDTGGKRRVKIETAAGQSIDLDDTAGKITVKNGKGAELVLDGPNVTITATQLKLAGSQILLGDGAGQAVPLGTTLASLLASHTHNTTAPGAPTGPPVPPLVPASVLSTTVKVK
jgi:phage baseplate assembly protein V